MFLKELQQSYPSLQLVFIFVWSGTGAGTNSSSTCTDAYDICTTIFRRIVGMNPGINVSTQTFLSHSKLE